MKVTVTISLSASYPIALRLLPEYPGRKLGIHFESGDSVTVYSQFRKCFYLHSDGNRYEIRFYELVDGLGWIHDFDVKLPRQRTILLNEYQETEAVDTDTVLLTNISSSPIYLHSFPEYPGNQLTLAFHPGEFAYMSSEFRKVYFVHTDGQRYCIRFYRLLDHSGWIHDFNPAYPLQRNLSQEILELPLFQVRLLAQHSGLEEISHNKSHHMISFKSSIFRFNVYYKTGTVATLSTHLRVGKSYNFRYNQSLEDLRHIFSSSDQFDLSVSVLDCADDEAAEETALRNQIARLNEESIRIENEKKALMKGLELFNEIKEGETKRRRWMEENKSESQPNQQSCDQIENRGRTLLTGPPKIARSLTSSPIRKGKSFKSPTRQDLFSALSTRQYAQTSTKGGNVRCNLPDYQADFVTQNWSSNVNSVAIAGDCIVFIYDDYSWSSTNGLPPLLLKKLHTRPTHLAPPAYVAAGSMNRCFLSFSDGSSEWNASDAFHKCIQEQENISVSRVAFGRHWNSFAILFQNGTIKFNNIPTELESKIRKKEDSPIVEIFLGPNGEWFLAREDGSTTWVAKSCEIAARDLGSKVTNMIFGSGGTFIVRYR
jgi:hypothetical protein